MTDTSLRVALAGHDGSPPAWVQALAQRIAADDRGLRWAGFKPLQADPAASQKPSGPCEARGTDRAEPRTDTPAGSSHWLAQRVLKATDRPRFGARHEACEVHEPIWPGLADQPRQAADTPVDLQLVFGPSGWPQPSSLPEARLHLFVHEAQLPEQIGAGLLHQHDLLQLSLFASGDDVLLRALQIACGHAAPQAQDPTSTGLVPAAAKRVGPEHQHHWHWLDSHALPTQSYSFSDLLAMTAGALPDFILSRLHWLAWQLQSGRPAHAPAGPILPAQRPLDNHTSHTPGSHASHPAATTPAALRLYLRWCQQRLRSRLQDEQWHLRVHHHAQESAQALAQEPAGGSTSESARERLDRPLHHYQTLQPPADTMWADPHMIEHGGHTYVFMEALALRENRGRIAMARLGPDGFAMPPVDVLDEPWHLSYPFVFEHAGEVWMVPETAARREVRLYRAHDFPYDWRLERTLVENADLADCTLWRHDGRWWLFANAISHPAVDERDLLNLYHTDDFRNGHWTAHPLNPIVTGVDRARMAGGLFRQQGALYRPCQYGARRYGFGFGLARIDVLSPHDYRESLVTRLTAQAEPALKGAHTFSRGQRATVIDVLQARWRAPAQAG